jgi:transposase
LVEDVRAFADLLTARPGGDLEDWLTAVEASDLPALHAFIRGLRKDLDAVVAGLSLAYSNGPIEGTNTKFISSPFEPLAVRLDVKRSI